MKWNFLYQITAASRTPDQGLPPPDPHSLCSLSTTEFVEPPPPEQNSWVRHWWCVVCTYVTVFEFRPGRRRVIKKERKNMIGVCQTWSSKQWFIGFRSWVTLSHHKHDPHCMEPQVSVPYWPPCWQGRNHFRLSQPVVFTLLLFTFIRVSALTSVHVVLGLHVLDVLSVYKIYS